jgi:hypothetical protein
MRSNHDNEMFYHLIKMAGIWHPSNHGKNVSMSSSRTKQSSCNSSPGLLPVSAKKSEGKVVWKWVDIQNAIFNKFFIFHEFKNMVTIWWIYCRHLGKQHYLTFKKFPKFQIILEFIRNFAEMFEILPKFSVTYLEFLWFSSSNFYFSTFFPFVFLQIFYADAE